MSEKINRSEWFTQLGGRGLQETLLGWLVVHGLTVASPDGFNNKVKEMNGRAEITPISPSENDVVDTFVFTVNGVDVPLLACFEQLEKHIEARVERKATELFLERIRRNPALNRMNQVLDRLSREMEDTLAAEFGFRLEEDR